MESFSMVLKASAKGFFTGGFGSWVRGLDADILEIGWAVRLWDATECGCEAWEIDVGCWMLEFCLSSSRKRRSCATLESRFPLFEPIFFPLSLDKIPACAPRLRSGLAGMT